MDFDEEVIETTDETGAVKLYYDSYEVYKKVQFAFFEGLFWGNITGALAMLLLIWFTGHFVW
jgi:hypothetical protein